MGLIKIALWQCRDIRVDLIQNDTRPRKALRSSRQIPATTFFIMIIKALIRQFFHCLMGMLSGHRGVASTTTYYTLGIPIWTKYRLIACVCGKVFYESKTKFDFEKRFGNSPFFIPKWVTKAETTLKKETDKEVKKLQKFFRKKFRERFQN